MGLRGFTIGPFEFDTGPGGQTLNQLFPVLDLAGYSQLRCTLSCSVAATDAADTLDVYIQSLAHDGVTWNDRGHFGQIIGTDSPSATAPEVRFLNIMARIFIESTEEAYESSGSVGGVRLPAGSVRNGPFPDKFYTGGLWTPNWRVQAVVVDADSNADFEFSVWVEPS